ncbi:MAG: tetratricopeptide repeat protein, partial [Anaerolineae bacterium]|nr:tetratricopeptide repeat protein [Anaerolineae bacterium]
APPAPTRAAPAAPLPLHQLPPPPADFVGREEELRELLDAVQQGGARLLAIRGLGGMGKTSLALMLGEQLEPLYPDAQLYIEMRGTEAQPLAPAEAMAQVVRAYYPLASLPEGEQVLRATYRSVLHGQRALLLLDNVRDRAQVEALVPPSTCLLLITSRQHFSLAGVHALDLGGIALPEAARLLQAIVPRLGEHEAEELAHACGRLPLALRVAGSALAEHEDLSPAAYVRRLRLDHAGLPAELQPVEASLALSDALLSGTLRERWHALSVFPETFERAGAGAVWGIERATEAQDTLSELLRYSLIEFNRATERYRLHDLTRAYGRARLGQAAQEQTAERHAAHYAGVLREVAEAFSRGGEGTLPALSRLDREWANIGAGQAWAAAHSGAPEDAGERAARLCCDYAVSIRPNCQLDSYAGGRLDIRLHSAWCQTGLTAARRLGDRSTEATCLGFLGILAAQSDPRSAKEHLEQALQIAQAIGDAHLEGWTLRFLGEAYYALGETEGTASSARQSLAIAEEIGDHALEVAALRQLGTAHYARGEADRAIAYHERALGLVQSHGFDLDLWALCRSLALDHYALGDARQAVEYGQRALAGAREIGDPAAQHASMYGLGLAYTALGTPERAISYHEENVAYYRETGLLHSVGYNLWALGLAYAGLGQDREAIAHHQEALAVLREVGDRRGQAQALQQMSLAHDRLGEREQAIAQAQESLALYEAIGHPQAEAVRAQLAAWRGE